MMKELADQPIAQRENFLEQLVDLFNRSNKTNSETIKFQDLTNYMIQHEIEHFTQSSVSDDLKYEEVTDIIDKSKHNQQIEKIYHFHSAKIDKVILYETNSRVIKVYDAATMTYQEDSKIVCPGIINSIEFLTDRNAIAISLSDMTLRFYELQ